MATADYTVTGMTCENCERHIREEVERIPGVTGVAVSRASGSLSVTAEGSVDDDAVIAAVDEAGYAAAPVR